MSTMSDPILTLFLTAKCIDGSITVMEGKKAKRTYRSELRAEQVDATRQRIIEAAVASFAPWAAELPFDKVAERARVSERTVYRHFPTQRDLLQAVTAHIVARSGWEPDELNAENLGPRTARAFTYFGTLTEGGEHQPEPQSPEMKALRAKRLETIERIVAPYTEGTDPELARGICAVFAELVRVQVFRGMYEQWGLSGAEAGRAVEWAINALFNELHRKEED
jgi:AcrR family transcriptional regulator